MKITLIKKLIKMNIKKEIINTKSKLKIHFIKFKIKYIKTKNIFEAKKSFLIKKNNTMKNSF